MNKYEKMYGRARFFTLRLCELADKPEMHDVHELLIDAAKMIDDLRSENLKLMADTSYAVAYLDHDCSTCKKNHEYGSCKEASFIFSNVKCSNWVWQGERGEM